MGKFYAISAGIDGGLWWLVRLLVFNSAIGLYYYLRWLVVLFDRASDALGAPVASCAAPAWGTAASLALLTALLLWLGLYPSPVIGWIRLAMVPLPGPVAAASL